VSVLLFFSFYILKKIGCEVLSLLIALIVFIIRELQKEAKINNEKEGKEKECY